MSGQMRKISPPPGFDFRAFQPVASRYTEYAIPDHVMVIIIIIIIILVITFMQGIYNCIPETKHVSMVHSVAAVLFFQFILK